MNKTELNARFAELNTRFDARAFELLALGMKMTRVEEFDVCLFTVKHYSSRKPLTVQSSFVMHAEEAVWADRVADLKAVLAS